MSTKHRFSIKIGHYWHLQSPSIANFSLIDLAKKFRKKYVNPIKSSPEWGKWLNINNAKFIVFGIYFELCLYIILYYWHFLLINRSYLNVKEWMIIAVQQLTLDLLHLIMDLVVCFLIKQILCQQIAWNTFLER